jgi:hypothetical protein
MTAVPPSEAKVDLTISDNEALSVLEETWDSGDTQIYQSEVHVLDARDQRRELRRTEARIIKLMQLLETQKAQKAAMIEAHFVNRLVEKNKRRIKQQWFSTTHPMERAAIDRTANDLYLARQLVAVPEGMSQPRRCCHCKGLVGRVANHGCSECMQACHLFCMGPAGAEAAQKTKCIKCCKTEGSGKPGDSTGTPLSSTKPSVWDKSRSELLQLKPAGLTGVSLFNHMCMLRRRQHGKYTGSPELDLETKAESFDAMYANIEQDIISGNLLREAAAGGRDGKIKIARTLDYLGEWKADPKMLTDERRVQKLGRYERLLKNVLKVKVAKKTEVDLKRKKREDVRGLKLAKIKREAPLRSLFVAAGIIAADHKGKSITKKSIVQLAKKNMEFGAALSSWAADGSTAQKIPATMLIPFAIAWSNDDALPNYGPAEQHAPEVEEDKSSEDESSEDEEHGLWLTPPSDAVAPPSDAVTPLSAAVPSPLSDAVTPPSDAVPTPLSAATVEQAACARSARHTPSSPAPSPLSGSKRAKSLQSGIEKRRTRLRTTQKTLRSTHSSKKRSRSSSRSSSTKTHAAASRRSSRSGGGKCAGGKSAGGKRAGGKRAGGRRAGGKHAGGKCAGSDKPGGDAPASGHRLQCGECPKFHKTKVFTSTSELVCDVCEATIKVGIKHHGCVRCGWDCCTGCDGTLVVAVGPKKKKQAKKKRKRAVRGNDEHCGKEIEMPASFWKITDGSWFKGDIKHTATWDFNGDTMVGYDVLWHTGESELVPWKDIKPYLNSSSQTPPFLLAEQSISS